MRRCLFPLVFVCLFSAVAAFPQRVIENESSFSIVGNEGVIRLVFESPIPEKRNAYLELMDVGDAVKATVSRPNLAVSAGKQTFDFRMKLGQFGANANDDLAWYRLRYSIGDAKGIVSLSQIMPDLFEMRIIAAGNVLPGMTYRARVRALNPFTEKPAPGVKIDTELKLELKGNDDQVLKLKASAETDADGFAFLDFQIPVDAQLDGDGEITVMGRRNGLTREAEDDLDALTDDVQILSMTDKPIYQPGQMLNVRGIVLKGGEGHVVLSGSEVEFRIEDEDDVLLYREKVTSSEYGIAAISWRIPANAKLGRFNISIRDAEGDSIGHHSVKVSRYDLPNFVVGAKPNKAYYLPLDKEAEIEIRADYLFGKPVTKGKVRVVEESGREWNYKEQKYDVDEGEVREGETDAQGKFIAKFDLADAHEEIKDDDYRRFEDVKFAAYFTDPTTNKTEQRRFDVRVSREPIHVYLIRGDNSRNPALPVQGFVSTFYADGTPAECDVEIRASEEGEDKFRPYARVRTNAMGAGKFAMPRPNIGDPDDDLDFRLIARDRAGRVGTENEEIYFSEDDEEIRVSTDRAIYKPGEAIRVKVQSTVKAGTVYVDVVSGWSVIESRFAVLKNGTAELLIPYEDQFKGELKIGAFVEDPDDKNDLVSGARGVIYPAKQGISVAATFDKAVYKPNEEATVKFGVLDVVGRAVESALGVVVFDKAVEERARTDADFGGMFTGLGGWLGYGRGFGATNIKNINELDLTKSIAPELQLVAEVILNDTYYDPEVFRSKRYFDEASSVFSGVVTRQFNQVSWALGDAYSRQHGLHATDDASLRSILDSHGIDLDRMADPWGMQYKAEFGIEKAQDTIRIKTAGPDKAFGTDDDFYAYSGSFDYFASMGKSVEAATRNYNARTGEFIRDAKTLAAELRVGTLLDRWGRPYRVETDGENRFINLRLISSGPDGKFEKYDPQYRYHYGDDFTIYSVALDLFAATERRITQIQKELKQAPLNEGQFRKTLTDKGIDLAKFRDGFGRPIYVTVAQGSRYWDKIRYETTQVYGDPRKVERAVVTPVTQQIVTITIRGSGRDGKENTWDDATFTQYVHVLSEQSKDDPKPVPVMQPISYSANTGSIAGTVSDANGAVVPGAEVTATNSATTATRTTTTSDEGRFLFTSLPTGLYDVKTTAAGFKNMVMSQVSVQAGATTQLNIQLEVGDVQSVVNVTSSAEMTVDASNVQLSVSGARTTSQQITQLPLNARNAMNLLALKPGTVKAVTKSGTDDDLTGTDAQNSTPRLREYFPETLLWQPQVVTDADGKAEVKFRMADNITTWKLYTIASTKNGKVGFAEKEVTAFQSFFVDLDPPKFLTTGDEIYLPTQVRNYTEKKQNVNVTMASADWFSFLGCDGTRTSVRNPAGTQTPPSAIGSSLINASYTLSATSCDASGMKRAIAVDTGQSENAVFGFKAMKPAKEARQRVTAIAQGDSDAIERPVTVRPDGHEVVHTESRYFSGNSSFAVNFPANALPATQTAELKIYPNPMAHVAESVEGLLRRPYGCAEQTISSTYPNVMILKFTAGSDGRPRRIPETIEKKARKFLRSGYERLLGYQAADGGFSYWGAKESADFALTAYALRFLADASAFVEIDPDVVKKASDWLIRQQRADGSWNRKYHWETAEDDKRSKSNTTYIARTLAMLARSQKSTGGSPNNAFDEPLSRALKYLASRNTEIDDPYSLSLFGLAAADSGDAQMAKLVAEKLRTLAKEEAGAVYWNLEFNTAFNGWGSAGRVETTALAAQLFLRTKIDDDLVGKAMLFLLKNKDRYGVWYSTQTTVNVLDAFVASMAANDNAGPQQVEVVLNGRTVKSLEIGPDKLDQIVVDLGGELAAGANNVELRSPAKTPLMAQVVANHYIDWRDADAGGRNVNNARALELDYKCDRTEAAVMNEITCSVKAERIGYRGYGMLLAEIGTPPGADVSRESLQAAMENDWSISRYDILPDRIVLYMWSKAGGTKFSFKFRPRYGINAKTPASTVYDYYNPEAQAVVAPLKFSVK